MTDVIVNFDLAARVKKGKRYALVVQEVGPSNPSLLTNRLPGEATPDCSGALFDFIDNKFVKDPSTDVVFATFVTTD